MGTVKSTVNISKDLMEQLKLLIKDSKISSITEALNMGLSLLLKETKREQYAELMKMAKNDDCFMQRTMTCQTELESIEEGVVGEW